MPESADAGTLAHGVEGMYDFGSRFGRIVDLARLSTLKTRLALHLDFIENLADETR
jgi:hypothetical protein